MESGTIILPFIAFLLVACCLTPPEQSIITNETPSVIVENQTNVSDEQWDRITTDAVEDHCLAQAREIAKEEGQPTFLVFGCDCTATETETTKVYDCEVSAADGSHLVKVDCVKPERRCKVVSESGTEYYTFEELEQLLD